MCQVLEPTASKTTNQVALCLSAMLMPINLKICYKSAAGDIRQKFIITDSFQLTCNLDLYYPVKTSLGLLNPVDCWFLLAHNPCTLRILYDSPPTWEPCLLRTISTLN